MAWVGVRMSVWHYDGLCFKHGIANLIFNSRGNIGSNRFQRRPGLSQSSSEFLCSSRLTGFLQRPGLSQSSCVLFIVVAPL